MIVTMKGKGVKVVVFQLAWYHLYKQTTNLKGVIRGTKEIRRGKKETKRGRKTMEVRKKMERRKKKGENIKEELQVKRNDVALTLVVVQARPLQTLTVMATKRQRNRKKIWLSPHQLRANQKHRNLGHVSCCKLRYLLQIQTFPKPEKRKPKQYK